MLTTFDASSEKWGGGVYRTDLGSQPRSGFETKKWWDPFSVR